MTTVEKPSNEEIRLESDGNLEVRVYPLEVDYDVSLSRAVILALRCEGSTRYQSCIGTHLL